MITKMHIENFKCFKDFDIELGPFNVLIGENDTGKTAFLQAVHMIGSLHPGITIGAQGLSEAVGFPVGTELAWRQDEKLPLHLTAETTSSGEPRVFSLRTTAWIQYSIDVTGVAPKTSPAEENWKSTLYQELIGGTGMFRFDPVDLRAPSKTADSPRRRPTMRVQGGVVIPVATENVLGPTGKGLPSYLLQFSGIPGGHVALAEIRTRLQAKFPQYKEILTPIVNDACRLRFGTIHGEVISADHVSDGVLLSLAFLALAYQPQPPRILLIEEPENGVHHASLKDIVSTLRHLSEEKGVQVIATTHSPYLLYLVEPEQVRIFTKDEEGAVHATNMADVPDVQEMKKHFQTGEIWTCLSEERLVRGAGEKR